MASVSERLRSVGGAGFAAVGEAGDAASEGSMASICGLVAAIWVVMGVSGDCAVLFAGGGVVDEDGRVRISTGLDDKASEVLDGRDVDVLLCCGGLWGAVEG